jgi:hypothetical protein
MHLDLQKCSNPANRATADELTQIEAGVSSAPKSPALRQAHSGLCLCVDSQPPLLRCLSLSSTAHSQFSLSHPLFNTFCVRFVLSLFITTLTHPLCHPLATCLLDPFSWTPALIVILVNQPLHVFSVFHPPRYPESRSVLPSLCFV